MKRIVHLIIYLILSVGFVFAQKIKITGKVLDGSTDNTPFESANVVLQTSDSVFVVGVSTDVKGNFKLDNLQPGDYRLIVSAIGYTDRITELAGLSKPIDLGELVLTEASQQLREITVTAANIVNQADRKVVFPTKKQLEASTNGINLLQALMLPRIEVNPLTKSVEASGGGAVQLCINGVKVSSDDINALQPTDILRIEYIENPGLRYGNAEAVLNYITRRYETGGSVSLDMTNSPHVVFHNDAISARLNHKKSEFSISYRASPRDFYECWRSNRETFHFEDGTTLNRYEEGKPGHLSELNHAASFTYNYQEPDKYSVNAQAGYWEYKRPHVDYNSDLYNMEYPDLVTEMQDYSNQKERRPYVDLYYQQQLKNRQFLALNLVGTYIYTGSERTYQERMNENLLTDIFSGIRGNKYSVIGEGIYEKVVENGRLSTGLKHTQAFSDNTYRGNLTYKTSMKQANTYLYTEFQGKWQKLNYSLGVGMNRSYLKQKDKNDYQTYTFRPRFSLQYSFSNHFYARLKGDLTNNPPALSELSAVEQMMDSIQIQRGNPNLTPYNQYHTNLYLEYRKGKASIGLSSTYQTSPKAIMESTFVEDGMFVHSYQNQTGFQYFNGELNVRAGMLWNVLQFSLAGGVNRFWSDGKDYNHIYTNWYYRAEVMAQYKKFAASFLIYNRRNRFWGETMSSGENLHLLNVIYRHKLMTFGAGIINPFVNNYKRMNETWNRYVSTYKEMYINESSRAFLLTFAWNFQFGRKYQSGGKKIWNQDTDAGVMNTSK